MSASLKAAALLAGQAITQTKVQEETTLVDQVWPVVSSWQAYTACALLAAGIIFAIYGWRISKVLAVVNFGVIGGFVGHYSAGRLGINDLACTVGLGVILAGLCIWQTRPGVSLLAGGAGGVLGAAVCYSLNLANATPYIWAGLLLGFVTFALLAFIIYKVAAVLYSSVQGSALVVAGTLSLLSSQQSIAESLVPLLRSHVFALPVMLGVPTIASIIIQQILFKKAPKWSIDG